MFAQNCPVRCHVWLAILRVEKNFPFFLYDFEEPNFVLKEMPMTKNISRSKCLAIAWLSLASPSSYRSCKKASLMILVLKQQSNEFRKINGFSVSQMLS